MRIAIVEDEIRIREGIVKLIHKISENYEIVGWAEDGEEGIVLIESEKPDLVITDIRMQKMDGLEMLFRLKESVGLPKVIVLSAYSEFEYAKQAITLGISEYLLKPISIVEFTYALRNIEETLQMERKLAHPILKTDSLDTIIVQLLNYEFEVGEGLRIVLWEKHHAQAEGQYCIAPFYIGDDYAGKKKKVFQEIHTMLEACRRAEYCIVELPQNNMYMVLFYNYNDERQLERWFQNRVSLHFTKGVGQMLCIGWSEFTGISNIRNTFKTLMKWMDWGIVLGSGVVISYPKVTFIQTVSVTYPISIEQGMRESLCFFDYNKIQAKRKEFIGYFQRGIVHSPKDVKKVFVRLIWSIFSVLKEINMACYEQFEQQVILDKVMNAITFSELEIMLERIFHTMMEYQDKDVSNSSFLIQRMKNLVYEFYNQGITLDEIAIELQMTPEYLGTLFHKEVGMTYSAYLKQYRIDKAKKLLIGTNLKTYEIAQQVGYSDAKYFSKVFKELEGKLPFEYRRNH